MGAQLARVAFVPPDPAGYRGDEDWLRHAGDVPYYIHDPAESDTILILSHGNAVDAGHAWQQASFIQACTGAAVLVYEYAGYGPDAQQAPTFASMAPRLRAVLDVARELGYARIFLLGWSIGSGPTCEVAADEQGLAGVILVTPFVSIAATVLGFPLGFLDALHNHRHVPEIRAPVHVLHGTEDAVVPYRHGERLHAAARRPGIFVRLEGAGHNDILAARHVDAVGGFLQRILYPAT